MTREEFMQALTSDTINKVSGDLLALAQAGKLQKALDVTTGLYGYSLAEPAKQLVPLAAASYGLIPRKVINDANSHNWKDILAISSPDPFNLTNAGAIITAGQPGSGAQFSTTGNLVTPRAVNFKPFAIGGQVDLESIKASQGFDPALAKETTNTLLLAIKLMWQAYLFGNVTDIGAQSVTGATVAIVASPVGSLQPSTTTYFVRIVPLTGMAANRIFVDVPGFTDANGASALAGRAVPAGGVNSNLQVVAGSGQGVGVISAEFNSGAVTGANQSLKITWPATPGAVAYAVFVGTTTGSANLKCECVVGQTQVTLTSLAGTGIVGTAAELPGADETGNARHFDGLLAQLLVSSGAQGAYVKNVNAALGGSATVPEVTQFQDAFAAIFQKTKLKKFRLLIGGAVQRSLTAKGILSNSMQIFASPDANGRVNMSVGASVGEIINAIGGFRCPVEVDDWIPPGTAFILPMEIPYPMANTTPMGLEWVGNYDFLRFDYYPTRADGPITPFDERCNGALAVYFSGGMGVLYNIWS